MILVWKLHLLFLLIRLLSFIIGLQITQTQKLAVTSFKICENQDVDINKN